MPVTARSLSSVVPAVFIAYFLCIHTPLLLHWSNIESSTAPTLSLMPVFLLFFVALYSVLLLPFLVRNRGGRERYLSFLIVLSVLIWATSSFLLGDIGMLAGFGLQIDSTSLLAKVEALAWPLALVGSIVLYKPIIAIGLQFVAGILLLSIALLIFNAGDAENSDVGPRNTGYSEQFLTLSKQANVIHIVLDELQTSVLKSYFAQREVLEEPFDGFTLFTDAVANYSSTLVSIPSMLSGSYYRNDSDVYRYAGKAIDHSPFLLSLKESGFTLDLQTIPELCSRISVYPCSSIPPGTHFSTALLLLDLSLFKSAPTAVKPLLLDGTSWLISDTLLNNMHESSRYGLAHALFEEFVAGLRVEDVAPSYKFFHSVITHSPQVYDQDCQIKEKVASSSLASRQAEVTCAFRHVASLLAKLKSLEIYDQTLILISSDHGSNLVDGISPEISAGDTIPALHIARAMAPLMVKPFASSGAMKISTAQVSMHDIPNTVLVALGMPTIDSGADVFSIVETQTRERNFFYYSWLFGAGKNNRLRGFVGYRIDSNADNPAAWTPLAHRPTSAN